MFRQLATNAGISIKKGDRVIISGRLRVRPWVRDDGRTGTTVEIDAETAGHDLMWGTANFRRMNADRKEEAASASTPDESDEATSGVDFTTGEIGGDRGGLPATSDEAGPDLRFGSETEQDRGTSPEDAETSPSADKELTDAPF